MRTSLPVAFTVLLAVAAIGPAIAQQNTGTLKTEVSPGRAGVFIDGKYVGPARNFGVGRKYTVAAGDHEVRLSEPRYEDYVGKITIQAGETTKLEQALTALPPAKPPFGLLRTVVPDKFAAVYVDNKFMGHAGEFNNPVQGLKLNPGEYTVRIVPSGKDPAVEERAKIETDKVTIVPAKAQQSASAGGANGKQCPGPLFSDLSGIATAADCK
jgi:hypothetical protein